MLKFSGFADLTSCLGKNSRSHGGYAPSANTAKMLFTLRVAGSTYALNAIGAKRHPVAQRHLACSLTKVSGGRSVRGNRH